MSRIVRSISIFCSAASLGVIYLALAAAPASGSDPGGCEASTCTLSAECPYDDKEACDYANTFELCQCLDDADGEGECACGLFGE